MNRCSNAQKVGAEQIMISLWPQWATCVLGAAGVRRGALFASLFNEPDPGRFRCRWPAFSRVGRDVPGTRLLPVRIFMPSIFWE